MTSKLPKLPPAGKKAKASKTEPKPAPSIVRTDSPKVAPLTAKAVSFASHKIKERKLSGEELTANILIYGDSGVGKTTLAGTFANSPVIKNVLWLQLEGNGDTALQGNPLLTEEAMDKISVIDIGSFKDFKDIYQFLDNHCDLVKKKDVEGLKKLESATFGIPLEDIAEHREFNCVVIDSLTEACEFSVYKQKGMGGNYGDAIYDDIKTFQQRDMLKIYGENSDNMNTFVRSFMQLPMTTIMTALVDNRQVEDRNFKYIKQVPKLTGKLGENIVRFFDIIGLYTFENILKNPELMPTADNIAGQERALVLNSIGRSPQCVAKFRFPVAKLPNILWDASGIAVFELAGLVKTETS